MDLEYAIIDSNETAYGAVINYTCESGYWISAENSTQTTQCQEDQTWRPTPQACQRERLYIAYVYMYIKYTRRVIMAL